MNPFNFSPFRLARWSVGLAWTAAAWLWHQVPEAGSMDEGPPLWMMLALAGVAVLAAISVRRVAHLDGPRWCAVATAALFGCWVVYFWQVGVVMFDVLWVLLPAPSFIAQSLVDRWDVLAGDFVQTVLKAVLIN